MMSGTEGTDLFSILFFSVPLVSYGKQICPYTVSRIETVMYVPVPACECMSPRLGFFTCNVPFPKCFSIVRCNCQNAKTACMRPVAPTGCPQARRPPDGLTGKPPCSGNS